MGDIVYFLPQYARLSPSRRPEIMCKLHNQKRMHDEKSECTTGRKTFLALFSSFYIIRSFFLFLFFLILINRILNEIELPFRILRLCGGDLGFTSALTYDFELFSTAQDKWLEISSVSTFEGFQSERLKLRYKANDGSKHLVHTLNGSSLALPRVLAGLLENCQTPEGIKIPKVLVTYTGVDMIS